MDTQFSIKNFRAFDNTGVIIDVRPITVLTGGNSSGKSSIVKAMMLLSDFFRQVREARPGDTPCLDFSRHPLSSLGNMETVLNKDSQAEGINTITFQYVIDSLFLASPLTITLAFAQEVKDRQKNGYLKDFTIKDDSGHVIYSGHSYQDIGRILYPSHYEAFFISPYTTFAGRSDLSRFKKPFFIYCLVEIVCGYLGYLLLDADKEQFSRGKDVVKAELESIKAFKGDEHLLSYYNLDARLKNRFAFLRSEEIWAAAKCDILFYLPVLQKIETFAAEEFDDQFRSLVPADGKLDVDAETIDKVLAEFHSWGEGSFMDFYRYKENLFLDTQYTMQPFSFLDDKGVVLARFSLDDGADEEPIGRSRSSAVSFSSLFRLVYGLDTEASRYVQVRPDPALEASGYVHALFKQFDRYRTAIIKEVFNYDICEHLSYIGSSRIEVKRLYTLHHAGDFGKTVFNYFEALRNYNPTRIKGDDYVPDTFLNKWLAKFGIGERFEAKSIEDGLGVVLTVYKDSKDKRGRLLADFGYGISQLISIIIEIETAILSSEPFLAAGEIDNVGDALREFDIFRRKPGHPIRPKTIAIEEPEIHLHPRFQSLLAEMFLEAYKKYNIQFIVETHSEYLIRKFQNKIAAKAISTDEVTLLYCEENSNASHMIREIGISEDGRLKDAIGPGFFDESDKLAMNLCRIQIGLEDE